MNNRNKKLVFGIVVYLLLGFGYGMMGEMRLAEKYHGDSYSAWKDSNAYIRSSIFSPFWPNDLFWTLFHCGNPLGCPIK